MIHRLALLIGSIAAAAILAFGFAATGFGPRAEPVDAEQPTPAAAGDAPTEQAAVKPVTRVETTTVYVRPVRKPKVIHVTKRATAPARRQTPANQRTRVVRVTGHGGGERDDEGGGGHERGDD
jgi:hypothetical protein